MKKISVATVDVHNSGNMNSSFGTLKVINLDYYLQGLFFENPLAWPTFTSHVSLFLSSYTMPIDFW